MILSGIMRHAVLRGRIERNPVTPVKVSQPRRKRAIRPMAPVTVEAIRREFLNRGDEWSATLVSVMAYAGLRPGEALALEWGHIGARTILVEQSNSESGPAADTKTKRIRTVRLLEPLAADLAAWRTPLPGPADANTVFPRTDGVPLSPTDYRNWRRRRFDPACDEAKVGPAAPRTYDIRSRA